MGHRIVRIATAILVAAEYAALWAADSPKHVNKPTFALSQATVDLLPEVQAAVVLSLQESFGDSSTPRIPTGLPLEPLVSSGYAIYAMHCARCHGESGDGTGIDGKKLNSTPRDFRLGIFKWKSTLPRHKALRHDLRETIRIGIPDTGMPAFAGLPTTELNSVVEYVRWLGMTGEFESRLILDFGDFSSESVIARLNRGDKRENIVKEAVKDIANGMTDSVNESLQFISERWKVSELESSIVRTKHSTPKSEDSIARGKELYLSQRTKCYACHGEFGKGDGPATRDQWKRPGTTQYFSKPGLHDIWGHPNQPWDLTEGKYRGGDAPDELFRRVAAGVAGTTMPAYAGTAITDAEIWDVVNFVESLRPEKLRALSSNRRPPPPGEKE